MHKHLLASRALLGTISILRTELSDMATTSVHWHMQFTIIRACRKSWPPLCEAVCREASGGTVVEGSVGPLSSSAGSALWFVKLDSMNYALSLPSLLVVMETCSTSIDSVNSLSPVPNNTLMCEWRQVPWLWTGTCIWLGWSWSWGMLPNTLIGPLLGKQAPITSPTRTWNDSVSARVTVSQWKPEGIRSVAFLTTAFDDTKT